MDVLVIGIAGGSGSGKTTVTNKIKDEFGDRVTVICHDSYYKGFDGLTLEEKRKLNYDHPNSLDTALLVEGVRDLKAGKEVQVPVYCFKTFARLEETHHVIPNRVILVEGILIFESQELCDLMDIKIFVDTDADIRFIRKMTRDIKDRGRDFDYVIKQYTELTKPMHEQFVEPSKKRADIIVPQGGSNLVALSMIFERIRSSL